MPGIEDALQSWGRASRVGPHQYAAAAARVAMHRALEMGHSVETESKGWRWPAGALRQWRLATGTVLAAAATTVALGWSAPPGSALHLVREGREQISLALAGSSRSELALTYADDRLATWRTNPDPAASLHEAEDLLTGVSPAIASDPRSSLRQHWNQDQTLLVADQRELASAGGGAPAASSGAASPGVGTPTGPTEAPAGPGSVGAPPAGPSHPGEPPSTARPSAGPTPHDDGHGPTPGPSPTTTPNPTQSPRPTATGDDGIGKDH